ncbi:MAG: SDR family oxidoreductase [Alphaproteobacteria bacterium]|nr:SDR family oxidoreductase [Alphaproteobacteria bacterium]
MDLGLGGRSALVMASTRGIGLATAQAYHREGANVTICGRDRAALDAAAATMPGAAAVAGDVTDPAALERIFAAATDAFGSPEILVVNAGGPPPGAFDSLDDAAWTKAVDMTLMSAIRAARLALPAMRERRWGRIVIVSSYGVKQPVPGLTLSNSVRMAVLGWAKTLARQVAGDNILVNTVCPGWTRTDRVRKLVSGDAAAEARIEAGIPLGRMGEPGEIANLAVFLGSAAASYMTGTAVQVDGGLVEGYA